VRRIALLIFDECAAPVATTLPAAVRQLVRRLQPERVLLFGSYAGGMPTPVSDVDLLVVLDTALPSIERHVLVSETLFPRDFPLDLIVVTPAELTDRLARGDRSLVNILRHGRILYKRPH
jgi:predicted nucleotidyltransferase